MSGPERIRTNLGRPSQGRRWTTFVLQLLSSGGPFAGLLLTILLFGWLTRAEGTFLTEFNFRTIAVQSVIVGLSALGMTLVVIAGGIDLSVGSQVALVTVVTAVMGRDAQWAMPACLLAGLAVGLVCGFLNGLTIDRLGLLPFIVTLGALQVYRGLAKLLAKNTAVYFPTELKPAWLSELMAIETGPQLKAFAERWPAPIQKAITAVPPALWTGMAGMMQCAEMHGTGDPVVASGLELEVSAAVVIGGGSLAGGEGAVLGTLVGALVMRVLKSGCVHAGIPNATQDILIGLIIVSAVAVDKLRTRLASGSGG